MNGNEIDDKEYWKQQEQQTQELIKFLPSNFKEYASQQIKDYLKTLSPEDKVVWSNVIGKNPILRRVIYYVFSPPEEIDLRLRMIANCYINIEFDIKYTCFLQTLPENDYDVLRSYLRNLTECLLRVFTADCQKKAGLTDTIAELRKICLRIEQTDRTRKTIIDQAPWTRYELLRKSPKEKVLTIYALDESDMSSRFDVDPFLIGWIQAFDNPNFRDEAYTDGLIIRVVDVAGNLVKPPKRYINPFFFSLRERYTPLLKKAFDIYKSPGIIEYEDIESCFFSVLKNSPGYINPRSLYWQIQDLRKTRNKNQKKTLKEEPTHDNSAPNTDEQISNSIVSKHAQTNIYQDNTNSPEEKPVDDDYEPSIQGVFEETLASDPLHILLDNEIIDTAKNDDRFWNLIISDKPKTDTERQYIHRFREKIKKI